MSTILDKKRRVFVSEFVKNYDIVAAAMAAGYRKTSARGRGAAFLSETAVQAAVEDASKKKYLTDNAQLRERIIAEITSVAFANAADYVKIREVAEEVKSDNAKLCQTVEVIPTERLETSQLGAIGEIRQGTRGVEIKLVNKLKALELLGKYVGIFKNDAREADTMERLDSVLTELNVCCSEEAGDGIFA